MIQNITYSILKLAIEFIKLFPLLFIVMQYELNSRKRLVACTIAVTSLSVVWGIYGVSYMPVNAILCVIYTLLIIKGKNKIIYTIITYVGVCILDMLAASVCMVINGYNYGDVVNDRLANILSNSITIVIVMVICVIAIMIRKKYQSSYNKVNVFYLVLILLGEISIGEFITAYQINDSNNKLLAIVLCVGGIVFLIMAVVMIINYISKNNYKAISEINKKLLINQEKYYVMLLEKEHETRKFRHDIRNHINCMHLLLRDNKYDELNNYFDKLGTALSELKPTIYTGNDIVSAIINDLVLRYPEVKYNIEGKLPNEINLSQMDLCTIFSNLLENAFWAANQSDKRIVIISFKFVGENFFCCIQNSVNRKVEIINNTMITEKKDKLNHGYGTENVKKSVKNNGGDITFCCNEDLFTVEFLLSNF